MTGPTGSLKSLHQFISRTGQDFAIRLRPEGPFGEEALRVRVRGDDVDYRLLSLPLYCAEALELS
ncbi:MAG: hypothetical protein JRH20_14310 [Deltaproteobacteria bacterium]|nr:hypothetical protein [Deltaproteobacteria bacterium]